MDGVTITNSASWSTALLGALAPPPSLDSSTGCSFVLFGLFFSVNCSCICCRRYSSNSSTNSGLPSLKRDRTSDRRTGNDSTFSQLQHKSYRGRKRRIAAQGLLIPGNRATEGIGCSVRQQATSMCFCLRGMRLMRWVCLLETML